MGETKPFSTLSLRVLMAAGGHERTQLPAKPFDIDDRNHRDHGRLSELYEFDLQPSDP
jgi:hypothetical protein